LQIKLVEFGSKQPLIGKLCLVFSDEGRRQSAAESVLNNLIVFTGTQQHADGRTFVSLLNIAV
jgi:hypothetical protein